jgi:hypothetical protein
LTYPQIVMLNHAASYNRKRMDLAIKDRRARGEATVSDALQEEPVIGGKKLTDMSSDEIFGYMGKAARPRVIKTTKDS